MSKLVPIITAVAVVVGGGSFYGGMKYAESKNPRGGFSRADIQNLSPEERQARLQQLGTTGRGVRGNGGGFTNGEIISKDDKSVTVKLPDGGSRIVFLSGETQIMKSAAGSPGDLVIGAQVTVNGSQNQDGSITAETVQLRPNPSPR